MSEDGELVERGALRLDPEAAAVKLGAYQLEDPECFLVPWFRAASALGAPSVSAAAVSGYVDMRFEGAELPPEVMRQPLQGLVLDGAGEAAQHVAWGALALRRLAPSECDLLREGTQTVLRAGWDGGAGGAARALERLRAAYGIAQAELVVDGRPVDDPAAVPGAVKTWKSRDVRVVVLQDPRRAGRIRFYKLGMLVEEEEFDLSGPYVAYAQSRRFALNLSQSRVVKDARYQRAVERLGRFRRRLAMRPTTAERLVDRVKDMLGLDDG